MQIDLHSLELIRGNVVDFQPTRTVAKLAESPVTFDLDSIVTFKASRSWILTVRDKTNVWNVLLGIYSSPWKIKSNRTRQNLYILSPFTAIVHF